MATTQVVFRSTDEGLVWRFQGTLMNPADYPHSQSPTAMSESALTELADGSLTAILRFDGDCGCAPTALKQTRSVERGGGECGVYTYYHQVFSTDAGRTWSKAKAVNGTGCVKPRLMMLGEAGAPGPLLLTGGRMCVENVTDLFLWLNSDGLAGSAASHLPLSDVWRRHSLSYVHNSLWRGDSAYTFDASINNSQLFETQGYTTLVRLGPLAALVAYNRYYHPGDGVPGCRTAVDGKNHEVCSTAFVMRLTLARKSDDLPLGELERSIADDDGFGSAPVQKTVMAWLSGCGANWSDCADFILRGPAKGAVNAVSVGGLVELNR
jgi:hypothetical protein